MKPIIAVMMVKNEDMWLRQSLNGIKNFADHILVVDTGSTDHTVDIARAAGVELVVQTDLTKTHQYIEKYVNTNTWVFGVDGDEIYDPSGLARMKKLLALETSYYEDAYQVQGQYFHAVNIDEFGLATGYPGPPSHTPTKLYNMQNILKWKSDWKHILFLCRDRVTRGGKVRAVLDTWEDSPLRCVHTRFMQRSTLEKKETQGIRLHGEDILGFGNRNDRGGSNKINQRLIYRKGGLADRRIEWL